jgi:hypothetical protein
MADQGTKRAFIAWAAKCATPVSTIKTRADALAAENGGLRS